jgi:hypothetical protein
MALLDIVWCSVVLLEIGVGLLLEIGGVTEACLVFGGVTGD